MVNGSLQLLLYVRRQEARRQVLIAWLRAKGAKVTDDDWFRAKKETRNYNSLGRQQRFRCVQKLLSKLRVKYLVEYIVLETRKRVNEISQGPPHIEMCQCVMSSEKQKKKKRSRSFLDFLCCYFWQVLVQNCRVLLLPCLLHCCAIRLRVSCSQCQTGISTPSTSRTRSQ